jgi:hypothetical protein
MNNEQPSRFQSVWRSFTKHIPYTNAHQSNQWRSYLGNNYQHALDLYLEKSGISPEEFREMPLQKKKNIIISAKLQHHLGNMTLDTLKKKLSTIYGITMDNFALMNYDDKITVIDIVKSHQSAFDFYLVSKKITHDDFKKLPLEDKLKVFDTEKWHEYLVKGTNLSKVVMLSKLETFLITYAMTMDDFIAMTFDDKKIVIHMAKYIRENKTLLELKSFLNKYGITIEEFKGLDLDGKKTVVNMIEHYLGGLNISYEDIKKKTLFEKINIMKKAIDEIPISNNKPPFIKINSPNYITEYRSELLDNYLKSKKIPFNTFKKKKINEKIIDMKDVGFSTLNNTNYMTDQGAIENWNEPITRGRSTSVFAPIDASLIGGGHCKRSTCKRSTYKRSICKRRNRRATARFFVRGK